MKIIKRLFGRGEEAVRWSAWFGLLRLIIVEGIPFSDLRLFANRKIILHLLIARLQVHKLHINLRLRISELRIIRNRTRMICLKRRYLFPEKGDLIADSWFARAGIYHPVEVVKVFLECFHKYWCMKPNNQAHAQPPADSVERNGDKQ